MKSPNVTINPNYLATVTAAGPDDVWAVGYWGQVNSDDDLSPLYEHWDGTRWSVVQSELQRTASFLVSAEAISSDDVVAVGSSGNFEDGGINGPLIWDWNGVQWGDPFLPVPDGGDTDLSGVAALASEDVWAVGHQNPAGADQTLAMHWDGVAWNICTTPNRITTTDNDLLAATSADGAVWAVGTYVTPGTEVTKTLIERWSSS